MEAIEKLTARAFTDIPHGFLGRKGGLSTGMHAGLNVGLGSDDDQDIVVKNRILAANNVFPNATLQTVYQIHSAHVETISKANNTGTERPKADGMVTNQPNILLGILTADCCPVLFADSNAGVVGAAHAGWKGAIGGVTDNVITAMENLGAKRENIIAATGPCISQKSYEVDEGFFQNFCEKDADNENFFRDGRPQHYQFDLEGYVAARLAKAGVKKIECLGEDTYAQEDRFYSYRLSCHRKDPDYGRQISLIGLPVIGQET